MNTKEYRAHKAVNYSSLKHILKSPAHYKAELEKPREETPAMLLGSLTHSVILESKMLSMIASVKPEGLSLATKEGKEWKYAHGHNPIISEKDAESILGMAASVRSNPHAVAMLKGCNMRETPIMANLRGVDCKCLIDAHGTSDGSEWVICDLKTTDDASPEAFARKVANFDYDMQKAFYSQCLAQLHQIETPPFWYWIVVEKTAPYTCAVYSSEEWEDSGNLKLERALELYKECAERNEWPQPYAGITKLERPRWA